MQFGLKFERRRRRLLPEARVERQITLVQTERYLWCTEKKYQIRNGRRGVRRCIQLASIGIRSSCRRRLAARKLEGFGKRAKECDQQCRGRFSFVGSKSGRRGTEGQRKSATAAKSGPRWGSHVKATKDLRTGSRMPIKANALSWVFRSLHDRAQLSIWVVNSPLVRAKCKVQSARSHSG